MIVIFSFGLGGAELIGVDLTGIAFALGLTLFVVVLGIRTWARSTTRQEIQEEVTRNSEPANRASTLVEGGETYRPLDIIISMQGYGKGVVRGA